MLQRETIQGYCKSPSVQVCPKSPDGVHAGFERILGLMDGWRSRQSGPYTTRLHDSMKVIWSVNEKSLMLKVRLCEAHC